MQEPTPAPANAQAIGWATVFVSGVRTRKAHYFGADHRSLCRKYLCIGAALPEANQEDGDRPTPRCCLACWRLKTGKQ